MDARGWTLLRMMITDGLFSTSSSGASFLAWFRKARNARTGDDTQGTMEREREVWVRGGRGRGGGASPSSNLCLVCKEIIFRPLKDHDLTVEPSNCLSLRGLFILFLPYQLLEEKSRSLYRGVQLTKEVILSGPLSWRCDIVPK